MKKKEEKTLRLSAPYAAQSAQVPARTLSANGSSTLTLSPLKMFEKKKFKPPIQRPQWPEKKSLGLQVTLFC
jgi:hypothetical protein